MSITWEKPKLAKSSGAELSNGLGDKMGYLQYQLPKLKSEAMILLWDLWLPKFVKIIFVSLRKRV